MTPNREARGPCLIEAGALDLQDGSHWQPWLRLAPLPEADFRIAAQAFHDLKPVFGSEGAAIRYAIELGRRLADEHAARAAAPGNPSRSFTFPQSLLDVPGAAPRLGEASRDGSGRDAQDARTPRGRRAPHSPRL